MRLYEGFQRQRCIGEGESLRLQRSLVGQFEKQLDTRTFQEALGGLGGNDGLVAVNEDYFEIRRAA